MTWSKSVRKLLISIATLSLLAGCGALIGQQAARQEARAEERYPPIGTLTTLEDGRQVHSVTMGNGPDLVLIHGASGNLRDFTFAFAGRMAEEYRVTVFDRPGLGWTSRANPAYAGAVNDGAESPREQARMLQEAASALGIERPLVLGHSYGGAVALAWALEAPQRTAALVILAGASNPWPGGLGPLYKINSSTLGGATVVPAITAFAPETRVEDAVQAIFAPQDPPEGYLDYVGAGLTLRRASLRANARQVNSLRPHLVEMSRLYPLLTTPTEIVHGTADDTVPIQIHSEPLARQIPGARLTRLEGVGHMPHHAAPEETAAAIHRAAARAGLR